MPPALRVVTSSKSPIELTEVNGVIVRVGPTLSLAEAGRLRPLGTVKADDIDHVVPWGWFPDELHVDVQPAIIGGGMPPKGSRFRLAEADFARAATLIEPGFSALRWPDGSLLLRDTSGSVVRLTRGAASPTPAAPALASLCTTGSPRLVHAVAAGGEVIAQGACERSQGRPDGVPFLSLVDAHRATPVTIEAEADLTVVSVSAFVVSSQGRFIAYATTTGRHGVCRIDQGRCVPEAVSGEAQAPSITALAAHRGSVFALSRPALTPSPGRVVLLMRRAAGGFEPIDLAIEAPPMAPLEPVEIGASPDALFVVANDVAPALERRNYLLILR